MFESPGFVSLQSGLASEDCNDQFQLGQSSMIAYVLDAFGSAETCELVMFTLRWKRAFPCCASKSRCSLAKDFAYAEANKHSAMRDKTVREIADVAGKAYILAEEPEQLLGTLIETPHDAVRAVNQTYADAKAAGEGVINDAKALLDSLPVADFTLVIERQSGLSAVIRVLQNIRGPLEVVETVIAPIQPLLSASDFLASITVDPVIDFVLKTLKIVDIIDAAARKVTGFLPDVEAFDVIGDAVDEVVARLNEAANQHLGDFDNGLDEKVIGPNGETDPNQTKDGGIPAPRLADILGFGNYVTQDLQGDILYTLNEVAEDIIDDVTGEVIGTTLSYARSQIGDLDAQGLGMALVLPEAIAVHRGLDYDKDLAASITITQSEEQAVNGMMLLGDDKDNVLTSYGGRNLLYGGIGDDTLLGDGALSYVRDGVLVTVGGSNERDASGALIDETDLPSADRLHIDTAVFTGPIDQYVVSGDRDGEVLIEQISPIAGSSFDGREVLVGIEQVAFLRVRTH